LEDKEIMHDYGAEYTTNKKEREFNNNPLAKKGRKMKKIKYTHKNLTSASPYLEYLPSMMVLYFISSLE